MYGFFARMCVCVPHMYLVPMEAESRHGTLELEVQLLWASPLQEHQVLLIMEHASYVHYALIFYLV